MKSTVPKYIQLNAARPNGFVFPQVFGLALMSVRSWVTLTVAGVPLPPDPTQASPMDSTSPPSLRQPHCPGTVAEKTTIQHTYPKQMVYKAFMKKYKIKSLIIFLLAHQHQPESQRLMSFPFQSIHTLKPF